MIGLWSYAKSVIKQSEVQNPEPVQKKANYTQVSLTTGATNNKEHYELWIHLNKNSIRPTNDLQYKCVSRFLYLYNDLKCYYLTHDK